MSKNAANDELLHALSTAFDRRIADTTRALQDATGPLSDAVRRFVRQQSLRMLQDLIDKWFAAEWLARDMGEPFDLEALSSALARLYPEKNVP